MKTIYLDIFSGISGDMFIGALLDLGVDFHQFERELKKLGLEDYHLHVSRQQRSSISGTKFDVHTDSEHHHGHQFAHHAHGHEHEHEHSHEHEHEHSHHEHDHGDEDHEHPHGAKEEHSHGRTFAEIKKLILRSPLSEWVKQKSVAVFQRIAVAEGKIHGQPTEQVHFHEVGAIDSIVDIVGACVALELLDRPRLLSAPVTEGSGWIDCAHGRFPIPAPATVEILVGRAIPITQCAEPHELVTPTGAALLAELVQSFGPMQDFAPAKIGYGLGTRENKTRPNVLRAILGETKETTPHDWEIDTIAVLETNLDDISGEILGAFVDRAMAAGALDVFYTPIQMKKNRPGVLLSILCSDSDAERFTEMVLRETSAFGVRRYRAERRKLPREVVHVTTPLGEVAVKLGRLNGRVIQAAPEFESCRTLAERQRVPLKQVYEAAVQALNASLKLKT
jgi:uncharacterized protein (TIGR00299 family) protein